MPYEKVGMSIFNADFLSTPDNVLCSNDRVFATPSLCNSVLKNLHGEHIGVEKAISLAKHKCWWSEINVVH